jgi:16S rRNA (guanine966-N2)-methyltransferase
MRVVSGSKKGHPLQAVPGKGTRPTVDKVKESVFNMIGPYFNGGSALDLYAGTGGLGIEALSRGMDRCIFVDANRRAVTVVRDNLSSTGLKEQAEVFCNDANRALKALIKRELSFDVVFLDPPYAEQEIESQIAIMDVHSLLHEGSLVVAEHSSADILPENIGSVVKIKETEYGQTTITVFRKN